MCALMVQQGCDAALETLPVDIEAGDKAVWMKKAYSTLIICLGDRVIRKVTKETTGAGIWTKLTSLYMTKSLANKLYMKKKLYTCTKLGDHIYEFNKLILDLANVDIEIEGEDQALMSNHSGKAHSGGSLRFKLRGGTSKLKRFICHSEGHLKRDCPKNKSSGFVKKSKRDQDSDSSDDEGNAYFEEALVVIGNDEITELVMDSGGSYHMTHRRDFVYDFKVVDGGSVQLGLKRSLISLGTLEKEGYTVKMQMGRIEHGGSKQVEFKQLGHKKVGFKQLGPGVEKGVHGVHDEKRVWFEVELQRAQRDGEAKVFQVSNDDAAVAQRRLKDKQLEEKNIHRLLGKRAGEGTSEYLGKRVQKAMLQKKEN
nr:retrovirus-related Pol polyprotein from transposon TNT 1-94 [Tanacetum cinerariifolium]